MGEYSNEDYPFACSPGVYGKTYRPATQSSPVCEKVCPAGFECTGATIEPVPCSLGSYCPVGSPSGVPCPEGFEGAQRGLKDASECSECPPGHWCTSGKRIQCAEGRYTNSSPAAPLRTDITSCLVCGHAARVLEPRPNPGRARAPELPRTSAPHVAQVAKGERHGIARPLPVLLRRRLLRQQVGRRDRRGSQCQQRRRWSCLHPMPSTRLQLPG